MRWICVRAREVFIAPVRPMQTRTLDGAHNAFSPALAYFSSCASWAEASRARR